MAPSAAPTSSHASSDLIERERELSMLGETLDAVRSSSRGRLVLVAGEAGVVDRNADAGVTWVHSYVSADKAKTFCVYDAPTPEAIRRTASRNDLPVDQITEVSVLDPYFYK